MDAERRTLYRHGALILLLSALLGIVTALPVPHPPKWMAAHVLEQLANNRLIRPRAEYTGPSYPQGWVPLDRR